MTESHSMFGDRRKGVDRRKQDLPMPAELDRRSGCRRNRSFQAQPWWLKINYAVELVSEVVSDQKGTDSDKTKQKSPPTKTKR